MKCLPVVAILLAGGNAFAGGYIGLGVGDGVGTSGDFSFSADGRTGRLLAGFSFGKIAVEGSIGRASLMLNGRGGDPYDATQAALAGKYSLPLSDGFEAFGRLGIQQTSVTASNGSGVDGSGKGILAGGGIEYRSKLPVTFWIDYTLANTSLGGAYFNDASLTTRQWMIGASLGL